MVSGRDVPGRIPLPHRKQNCFYFSSSHSIVNAIQFTLNRWLVANTSWPHMIYCICARQTTNDHKQIISQIAANSLTMHVVQHVGKKCESVYKIITVQNQIAFKIRNESEHDSRETENEKCNRNVADDGSRSRCISSNNKTSAVFVVCVTLLYNKIHLIASPFHFQLIIKIFVRARAEEICLFR